MMIINLLVQNALPFVADEVEGEVTSGVVRRDPDYKKTVYKKLDRFIKTYIDLSFIKMVV